MFRKISLVLAFVFAAFSLVASPAMAAVNYDPSSGGAVGKGDVQTALGMNNTSLQNAVKNNQILFTYDASVTYSQVCTKTWETGGSKNRETHVVSNTYNDTQIVVATVQYDVKAKNQVSGFVLAPVSLSGTAAPENLCPNDSSGYVAEDAEGNLTAPEIVSSSGGLFVNGMPLPNTPVV